MKYILQHKDKYYRVLFSDGVYLRKTKASRAPIVRQYMKGGSGDIAIFTSRTMAEIEADRVVEVDALFSVDHDSGWADV